MIKHCLLVLNESTRSPRGHQMQIGQANATYLHDNVYKVRMQCNQIFTIQPNNIVLFSEIVNQCTCTFPATTLALHFKMRIKIRIYMTFFYLLANNQSE